MALSNCTARCACPGWLSSIVAPPGRRTRIEVSPAGSKVASNHDAEGIGGEDCQDALVDFFSGEPFTYREGAVEAVSERAAPAQV